MKERSDPLLIEAQFFRSLVNADVEALDRILADDFILIDVMKGAEITKLILQAAIASGQVKFATIEPADPVCAFIPTQPWSLVGLKCADRSATHLSR